MEPKSPRLILTARAVNAMVDFAFSRHKVYLWTRADAEALVVGMLQAAQRKPRKPVKRRKQRR